MIITDMGSVLYVLAIAALLACSAVLSGLTLGLIALSHHELKQKAQLGLADALKVFPLRASGHELLITLLLVNMIVNSLLVVLLNVVLNGVLAVLIASLLITVFAAVLPQAYLKKHGLKFGARLSPIINKLLMVFHPLAGPLGKFLDRQTGDNYPVIYSKSEIFKIFDEHRLAPESDISSTEIQIIRHALSFGDKFIREVMTPRRVVKLVAAKDTVGPVLMGELHDSGFSRFPVYQDTPDQIVGTLYLHDLVNAPGSGKVRDIMDHKVFYIHDEQTLDHALQAFIKTKHHLFIVINSFEEFVGIVTIEDILEQIIGKKISGEFDQFDDLRAVAKLEAKEIRKEHSAHLVK